MIRNDIIPPHFGHRGLLIRPTNIAHPLLLNVCRVSKRREQSNRIAQILCSEDDGCLEGDGCLRSDHRRVENEICAMFCRGPEQNRMLEVWSDSCNPTETFLMRSKLAISALVVASLFGSTLIAAAQYQTAPGASSEGTVSPGATRGKKTQHEKGMTTGSSMRGGAAQKGGAANPSDQDNAGSGADTMAAPKGGSKY